MRQRFRKSPSIIKLILPFYLLLSFHDLAQSNVFREGPELIRLSIAALQGEKPAKKKLLDEYALYRSRLEKNPVLEDASYEIYSELLTTLEILSPKTASDSFLPQPENSITLLEPLAVRRLPALNEIKDPRNEQLALPREAIFFNVPAGRLKIFHAAHRDLYTRNWLPSLKIFKQTSLAVKHKKSGALQTLFLEEFYESENGRLLEQSLVQQTITASGVKMKKEVTYNHSSPDTFAATGRQEPFNLVRFPLNAENRTENFEVKALSAAVHIGKLDRWGCLLLHSQIQAFAFDPENGLILMDIYDDKWQLAELKDWNVTNFKDAPARTRKALKHNAVRYCKSNGFKFKELLYAKAGTTPDRFFTFVLAYKENQEDSDQKIYLLLKLSWELSPSGWTWPPETINDDLAKKFYCCEFSSATTSSLTTGATAAILSPSSVRTKRTP